jgi:hypothetical protein
VGVDQSARNASRLDAADENGVLVT